MHEVAQPAGELGVQSMPSPVQHRSAAEDWIEVIKRPSLEVFSTAFTQDVSLDGSVLAEAVVGAERIRQVFLATRSMYDAISFVAEAATPRRVYLEWVGRFRGLHIAGVTVLSKDASGLIEHVGLYHRPKAQVSAFSEELTRMLAG
jgi:hypothetical protein